jgi:hypothetical protein
MYLVDMDSSSSQTASNNESNTWFKLAAPKPLDNLSDDEKYIFRNALAENDLFSHVTHFDETVRHLRLSAFRPRAERISKFLRFLS